MSFNVEPSGENWGVARRPFPAGSAAHHVTPRRRLVWSQAVETFGRAGCGVRRPAHSACAGSGAPRTALWDRETAPTLRASARERCLPERGDPPLMSYLSLVWSSDDQRFLTLFLSARNG